MSGVGITGLRGSIGGSTVQVNSNGLFVRNKPIPTQQNTSFQIGQQAAFEAVNGHWPTLTEEQRLAWIAFAATSAGEYQNRLGITQNYTGQQLFMKLNLAAYETSFAIEDPPIVPAFTPNPLIGIALLIDTGVLDTAKVDFTVALEDANMQVKLFATASLSPGISRPRRSLFKLVNSINGDTASPTVDFTTVYFDRFGLPTVGKKVFVLSVFQDIASGFELVNSQISGIVTELV